jgi:hypothetical protein
VGMNSAIPPEIKGELDKIKSEVRSLKDTVTELVKENRRLIKRLKGQDLDMSDVSPDELMREAARVFNVTSKYDPDDDNISPTAVIKPVDWSSYA